MDSVALKYEKWRIADREAYVALKNLKESLKNFNHQIQRNDFDSYVFTQNLANLLITFGEALIKLEKARWESYYLIDELKNRKLLQV
ncbi:MAG: hypothetical protein ACTSV7_07190 [Candidatus Baldrarchaeia archaeon]